MGKAQGLGDMMAVLYKPLIMVLTALLMASLLGSYLIYGPMQREAGKDQMRFEALQAYQSQMNERNQTNETINALDLPDLCNSLGGVFTNGQCE